MFSTFVLLTPGILTKIIIIIIIIIIVLLWEQA